MRFVFNKALTAVEIRRRTEGEVGCMSRRGGYQAAVATALVVVAATTTAGCDRSSEPTNAKDVRVVATTTVLGDVVGRVVKCAGGSLKTVMPVGADPHDFAPSSADMTAMVKANLVVANGLGLEEGLKDALANAKKDGAKVFEVAPKLDPLPFGDREHAGAAGSEPSGEAGRHHEHGSQDPHVWLDAARMATAAKLVAAELGKITKDTATFDRCGDAAAAQLTSLDTEVRRTLELVPAERRVMITDHEAFGYFAKAYGYQVAGVVIPGGSTLAKPSSAEIATLVGVIRDKRVPVIFSNASIASTLVDTVAKEAGSQVKVVQLYVESVGKPGSGAETYQGMMRTDATRIADALKG